MVDVPRPPLITRTWAKSRPEVHDSGYVNIAVQTVTVVALPPGEQLTVLPPQPALRSVTLLTHTDSFKLPLQQALPTGEQQQELPPKSQRRNLPDWQDYILPWSQAPPVRQNDWPLPPRAARPPILDWINFLIPPTPSAPLPLMGQIWME